MTKIRIGTRGSKLALVQTTLVAEAPACLLAGSGDGNGNYKNQGR